jgi:hypothetical protein
MEWNTTNKNKPTTLSLKLSATKYQMYTTHD